MSVAGIMTDSPAMCRTDRVIVVALLSFESPYIGSMICGFARFFARAHIPF